MKKITLLTNNYAIKNKQALITAPRLYLSSNLGAGTPFLTVHPTHAKADLMQHMINNIYAESILHHFHDEKTRLMQIERRINDYNLLLNKEYQKISNDSGISIFKLYHNEKRNKFFIFIKNNNGKMDRFDLNNLPQHLHTLNLEKSLISDCLQLQNKLDQLSNEKQALENKIKQMTTNGYRRTLDMLIKQNGDFESVYNQELLLEYPHFNILAKTMDKNIQALHKLLELPANLKVFLQNVDKLSVPQKIALEQSLQKLECEILFVYNPSLHDDLIVSIRPLQARAPHPTLIGGVDPMITTGGTIDIKFVDGQVKITKMRVDSGHFRPGMETMITIGSYIQREIPPYCFDKTGVIRLHTYDGDSSIEELEIMSLSAVQPKAEVKKEDVSHELSNMAVNLPQENASSNSDAKNLSSKGFFKQVLHRSRQSLPKPHSLEDDSRIIIIETPAPPRSYQPGKINVES